MPQPQHIRHAGEAHHHGATAENRSSPQPGSHVTPKQQGTEPNPWSLLVTRQRTFLASDVFESCKTLRLTSIGRWYWRRVRTIPRFNRSPIRFDVPNDSENSRACNIPAEKQRSSSMSHHYSGPDFGFPLGDARLDLTDVYVFPAPGDATRSVLIMNVHPSSTVIEPKPTTTEPFSPDALYEIKIDTDGDAVADIAYRIRVSSASDEKQVVTVTRAEGARAAGTGIDGEIIIYKAPVSSGREALISRENGCQFFAGWRSES